MKTTFSIEHVNTDETIVTDSQEYLTQSSSSPNPVIVERVTLFTFIKPTPDTDDLFRRKYLIFSRDGEVTIRTNNGNTIILYLNEGTRLHNYQGLSIDAKGLLLILSFDPSSWRISGIADKSDISVDKVIESAMHELKTTVLCDLQNVMGEKLSIGDLKLKHLILKKNAYVENTSPVESKPILEPLKELPKKLADQVLDSLHEASDQRNFVDWFHLSTANHPLYIQAEAENICQEAWSMCDGTWGSVCWKIDFYQSRDKNDGIEYEKFDQLRAEGHFVSESTQWDVDTIADLIGDFEVI